MQLIDKASLKPQGCVRSGMLNCFYRICAISAASALISLVMMLLTFAANFFTLSQGSDSIKITLSRAINDGAFLDKSTLGPLSVLSLRFGREPYTYQHDCLIWTTLLAQPSGGLAAKVLRTPRLDPANTAPDSHVPPNGDCQAISQALATAFPGPHLVFYDRYIIGQRAIAQLLLDNFSVHKSAAIMRATLFSAFAIVLILAWYNRATVITCIAAIFLLFDGLNYFGSMLYFAPIDFLHVCVLLTAIYVPFGMTTAPRLVLIGAFYGAAVAIFEILTGGIPMALVLLALLVGTHSPDRNSLFRDYAVLAFSFIVAVIGCFAIKLIAVSGVFGVNPFADFLSALLHRVHGSLVSEESPEVLQYLAAWKVQNSAVTYLIVTYAFWSRLIGWGSPIIGCLLPVAGLMSLGASTLYLYRRRAADSAELLSCWLGMGVIVAWVTVFWNHTVLHAHFMARLLVVPVICGAIATLAATRWRLQHKKLVSPMLRRAVS